MVKLTTRGRYAVMALVGLSQNDANQPMPLSEIAESGHISLSYLEQLFAALRRHGLVKSYRGPGGGYVLARPAQEISIAAILHAAEDCLPAKRNEKNDNTEQYENCRTQLLWTQVGEILHIALVHVSLSDVVDGRLSEHPHLNKMFETLS